MATFCANMLIKPQIVQHCVVWQSVLWEQTQEGDAGGTITTLTHLVNAIWKQETYIAAILLSFLFMIWLRPWVSNTPSVVLNKSINKQIASQKKFFID